MEKASPRARPDSAARSGSESAISVAAQEEQDRFDRVMSMKLRFDDSEDEDDKMKRMKEENEANVHEEDVKVKLPWYTFDHASKPRNIWDLFVIALALWNCIFIPFEVAFKPEKSDAMFASDRVIDVLFAVDIIVNFMTTYVNPKTNTDVTDPQRIIKNYVFGGRFWIDLLASIPFDLLIVAEEPDPAVVAEEESGIQL